jgi:hypothetical protein
MKICFEVRHHIGPVEQNHPPDFDVAQDSQALPFFHRAQRNPEPFRQFMLVQHFTSAILRVVPFQSDFGLGISVFPAPHGSPCFNVGSSVFRLVPRCNVVTV